MVILMSIPILAISLPAKAASSGLVGSIGNTPPTTQGFPNLGPLPSGVTPAYTITQVAYMNLSPNPIGVGQMLLVNVWCSPGTYHAFAMTDYYVDIKKPDGTTETIGPFNSYTGDCTAWFNYIPDQVGTWQWKFRTLGTYIPKGHYWDLPGSTTGGYIATSQWYDLGASIWYQPAETDWQNLTVQANMVSSWPYRPMTTDYWTRPVNPMWRDWWSSLGDYPFNSVYYYPDGGRTLYPSNYKFIAYVKAPNTAHIVWKRTLPNQIAGMIGGYTYQNSAASSPGTPSIIYAGRCYQSVTKFFPNGTSGTVYQCYDLRTGQVFWERGDLLVTPSIIEYTPPNPAIGGAAGSPGHEADVGWTVNFIAISGSFLYRFSPSTGAMTGNYSISPISGGTYYMPGYALSVQTIGSGASATYRLINWTTWGTSTNFTTRIANNITWPTSSLALGMLSSCADYEAGLVAGCQWNTPPGPQWCIGCQLVVADLRTGNVLWNYSTNDTVTQNAQSPSSFVMDHGKLAFGAHGRHWTCFDARTGKLLWTSDQTAYPWGAWWPYSEASYDINETTGAIITSTYEGIYAINWADGKILWHFSTADIAVPFEGPYNAEPFFTSVEIADGKVYAYNGEHTPSYPRDRQWSMYCINATNGQLLWKIHNPMVPGAVADGYLTASNSYDGYMYVFGKGQSQSKVSGPDTTVPLGTAVLIKGTVMDESPAQPGTPCVSKDSMELQMEVIHEQMPQTGLWGNETLTGVPVILTAIASDGTVTDLGSVTTNGYYGTFGYAWTPTKEGLYTIMASFAGDDSYGSSSAATVVNIGPAPATPTPTPTPPAAQAAPDYTGLIIGSAVAIIIAVAIVGMLILRKRP
jgi:outer membrane protein assembly factor BamB